MQQVYAQVGGEASVLDLPAPHEELMDGVRWGAADEFFHSGLLESPRLAA